MKKTSVNVFKPRNPFVAAARFRRAGAHMRRDISRQAAQLRLRNELKLLRKSP